MVETVRGEPCCGRDWRETKDGWMYRATKLVALAVVCTVWAASGCGSSSDGQGRPLGPLESNSEANDRPGGFEGAGGRASAAEPGGSGGAAEPGGSGGATEPGGSGGATEPGGSGGAAELGGSGGAAEPGGSGGATDTGGSGGATDTGGSGGATDTGGSGGSGGSPNPDASGTIVPLYTYPTDSSWDVLIAAKQAHPGVIVQAIINPASGPGDARDQAYADGIAALDAAGVVVVAYVTTSYAGKDPSDVRSEIDQYHSWYPGLRGIFFDEMSNTPGDEDYYTALTQYVKSLGFSLTIGNPGAESAPEFVGTVDTILIYESQGLPTVGALGGWHEQFDRSNFGIIPYGVSSFDPSFVAAARPFVGFVYVTDDQLPNPWDSLPPYFDGLMGALD